MPDALVQQVRDRIVPASDPEPASSAPPEMPLRGSSSPTPSAPAADSTAQRLGAVEARLLAVIQWVVFGGVTLLTLGAGALSWSHLTHVAEANGHIAPPGFVFLFPTIIDGFMILSSGVVFRHALVDERGGRTWYAGALASGTALLSICLNVQDSTGLAIVPAWMLPAVAPGLYLLGTELGLTELRLLMRRLRARIQQAQPPPAAEPSPPSKKELVLAVLRETDWNVRQTLATLEDRGVRVDRSYVYEIKREERAQAETA